MTFDIYNIAENVNTATTLKYSENRVG